MSKIKDKESSKESNPKSYCGLCGKRSKLMKADCCGNWIRDNEDKFYG